MKLKFIIIGFLIIFVLLFCSKESSISYRSYGVITGADPRVCACCGGYYIKIDTTTYEFSSIPENSNIDLQKDTFPIFVKLNWELSNRIACPYLRITVQGITKYNKIITW